MKQKIHTRRQGTKTHVSAVVSSTQHLVAIFDVLGKGRLYVREMRDGGWYYSELSWDRVEQKHYLYSSMVRLFRFAKRKGYCSLGIHDLAYGRGTARPLH